MQVHTPESLTQITHQIDGLSIGASLSLLSARYPGKVTFSTSFSFEDQVIAHHILHNRLPISIFTLDTGRLFGETYSVWASTNERYHAQIKAYHPDHSLLEPFIQEKGPNSFYESVENRKSCCHIRKVEPLKRALAGNQIWVTGLRSEHSSARENLQQLEWDAANRIIKYHPLLHWTTEQTRAFIDENNIPYNPLHDKGFISIGCAPCTRAIKTGEDFRAGRWWWEDSSKKECGLHEKQIEETAVKA